METLLSVGPNRASALADGDRMTGEPILTTVFLAVLFRKRDGPVFAFAARSSPCGNQNMQLSLIPDLFV
jgi:hypothetical protein